MLAGLWLAWALLAGAAAQAQDDPPGRVGRLAAVQGEVWVYEPEPGEWVAALPNRPFTGADRLATGNASSVEVRIGSTTLLLGSQAELEALRLDDERMQFRLLRGTLGLLVRSDEMGAELELVHPEAGFLPRRAGLYRIDRQEGLSEATVTRGELRVEARNLIMTLQAGQRAAFWRDGPLGDSRSQWLGPQVDEFALALQSLDQADSRSAAALYVSPEMTGAEDLDRHGRWQQHPEYGAVWSPIVVSAEWAPYRYGQWVWLRPWGWTWVDNAPWGFAPFHYGRWLWWGNRWCWAPGPKVARPVYAPALVGWLGGGHQAPSTGWIPLGPRDPYRPPYGATAAHVKRLNPHLPQGSLSAPAFSNRGAPGAVTVVPGPALASRQPIGSAAVRVDDAGQRRFWQPGDFHHIAPARPAMPARDVGLPRAGVPMTEAAPSPQFGRPRVPSVAPVLPALDPGPLRTGPAPVPAPATVPPGTGPFHGRPTNAAPVSPGMREPAPRPATGPSVAPHRAPQPGVQPPTPAPAAPQPAKVAPVAPVAPVASTAPAVTATTVAPVVPGAAHGAARPQPAMPAPGVTGAAPAVPRPAPALPPVRVDTDTNRAGGPQAADPGERRRTPESRYTPRER